MNDELLSALAWLAALNGAITVVLAEHARRMSKRIKELEGRLGA